MAFAAAGMFALILALILGIYWLFVVRPETRTRAELHERIKPKAPARKRRLLLASDAGAEGETPPAAVQILRTLCAPVQRHIERAGMKMSVAAFLLLSVWAGTLTGVLLWLGSGRMEAGLLVGGIVLFIPHMYVQYRGGKRTWKFEEQFPEAVDLIARALRAGHALPTAIGMVAAEVPNPVGAEFKKLYEQQNFGMSLPDALRAFADRVPILDARFFVTAVLTQREAGGNLAGVLDNLASVIRERFKVKRQVKVISAHGRITASILSAMPPVLAAIITVISPAGMMLLINDSLGIKMIVGAVILQLVGMMVMRKIVNVEF
jgi:tight adherence protein B